MFFKLLLQAAILCVILNVLRANEHMKLNEFDNSVCQLSDAVKQEISSYRDPVNRIIEQTTKGPFKGQVYRHLADFVDKFGPRPSGSINLEKAIDYVVHLLKAEGLDNVHTENANVTHWVRGEEWAMLLTPRFYRLSILGLGGSIGTPSDGITAEAIVVKSFDELQERASEVKGKIVVFNQPFVNYAETVHYRIEGAAKAAELGAIATLIRSVTSLSLYTVHTGMQTYQENVTKIPTASITVEDAELLWRMANRGKTLKIHMKMTEHDFPSTTSRNTIAEMKGHQHPQEVVLISGHLDSWDVGEGAMDDGGGSFISIFALNVIKRMHLHPRRTIRCVLWTGEETGMDGVKAYISQHQKELSNFSLVMESDIGTFTPLGLSFSGTVDAGCILHEILSLLEPINATSLMTPSEGSDIEEFEGVPQASLLDDTERYFWYHHTNADRMDVLDSDTLDLCVAVWAAVSYVVADLQEKLPR